VEGSDQPGSGLGLAIVEEVAERHRATVEVGTGSDGRGSVFTVRFPHHGAEG
jgi:two-component system sensor histidine kinase TctE